MSTYELLCVTEIVLRRMKSFLQVELLFANHDEIPSKERT